MFVVAGSVRALAAAVVLPWSAVPWSAGDVVEASRAEETPLIECKFQQLKQSVVMVCLVANCESELTGC